MIYLNVIDQLLVTRPDSDGGYVTHGDARLAQTLGYNGTHKRK